VDGVERRPRELRGVGVRVPGPAGERIKAVEQLGGEGAEIAAAQLLLALGELGDYFVGLGLGLPVAGRGV